MNQQLTEYDQYQMMLDNYASIVEKTNQQLSVWSNPYGLMIGVLTFIVTVGAIIVAWYIWKNSKEQKDLFKETLLNYQNTINDQAKIFIEQKKIEIDKTIQEFEKIKDSVTEEKKAEFQKVIDEYKKEKENIYYKPVSVKYDSNYSSLSSIYASGISLNPVKSTHCTNCGLFFKYEENNSVVVFMPGRKKVFCPRCNTENFV